MEHWRQFCASLQERTGQKNDRRKLSISASIETLFSPHCFMKCSCEGAAHLVSMLNFHRSAKKQLDASVVYSGLQTARLFFLPLLAIPNHVLVQVSFGKLTTISFTQTKDSES